MNRILVVKIAAIGDVVMTLPFLKELRRKYPKGQITWVCGSRVAPLLKATGLVNRLIEVNEQRLLAGALLHKVLELVKIWIQIGGRLFDVVFTLHADARYGWISRFVRCSDRRVFCPIPGRYHAQEYLRVLDQEEGAIVRKIEFPVLALPLQKLESDKQTVILAPGGAKNVLADDFLRRWPVEAYVEVAKALVQKYRVVVVGGETDEWILPYFRGVLVENRIGAFQLLELLSFFQNSALLITHDSGPLHLAKLVGCPVLALFGPTNPYEKTSDQENVHVIWGGKKLACRPCYHGKVFAKCSKNVCLEEIHASQVIGAAEGLLQKS